MVKPGHGWDPLLRRPFSVFEILRDSSGAPSASASSASASASRRGALFESSPATRVQCLGPLGRPFTLPEAGTQVWMVAGGVGLAPFVTVTEALAPKRRPADALLRRHDPSPICSISTSSPAIASATVLATEDGSQGERGRVTVPLERALAALAPSAKVLLHACGPERMLAAVARLAGTARPALRGLRGARDGLRSRRLLLLRRPGEAAGGGFHHVRSCIGGPVFDASTLVWEW